MPWEISINIGYPPGNPRDGLALLCRCFDSLCPPQRFQCPRNGHRPDAAAMAAEQSAPLGPHLIFPQTVGALIQRGFQPLPPPRLGNFDPPGLLPTTLIIVQGFPDPAIQGGRRAALNFRRRQQLPKACTQGNPPAFLESPDRGLKIVSLHLGRRGLFPCPVPLHLGVSLHSSVILRNGGTAKKICPRRFDALILFPF